MTRRTQTSLRIRDFVLHKLELPSGDIARQVSKKFGISRQAAHYHLKGLVDDGFVTAEGSTRNRQYQLVKKKVASHRIPLTPGLAEDQVWRGHVFPILKDLSANTLSIWQYGFTEMLNNAIEHSEGTVVRVEIVRTPIGHEILLFDDGVGIFAKLMEAFNLEDPQHAALELAKGKFTTDPDHHTGEGIFFSSKVFSQFRIISGTVHLTGQHDLPLHIVFPEELPLAKGTGVDMRLHDNVGWSLQEVFDKYTASEEYTFSKTLIPVKLAQYGDELLVSRSQAKRMLARVERFDIVVLDFRGVRAIGQAFADEVFRVYRTRHASVQIEPINASQRVMSMIQRVTASRDE